MPAGAPALLLLRSAELPWRGCSALPASPAPRNPQAASAQTEGFKGLRGRLPR